ncbi:unnamed protein product [Discula destructiva]
MRVRLNHHASANTAATAAATWAREVHLDTSTTRALDPAQTSWVRAWIDSLPPADSLTHSLWTLDGGCWETIASKEGFHIIAVKAQLDQADHEFRVAVAVQKQRQQQQQRQQQTIGRKARGEEDVQLVLVEVEPARRASWLRGGWGPHGARCEGPGWEEVLRRLREQWGVDEQEEPGDDGGEQQVGMGLGIV